MSNIIPNVQLFFVFLNGWCWCIDRSVIADYEGRYIWYSSDALTFPQPKIFDQNSFHSFTTWKKNACVIVRQHGMTEAEMIFYKFSISCLAFSLVSVGGLTHLMVKEEQGSLMYGSSWNHCCVLNALKMLPWQPICCTVSSRTWI